MGHASVDEVADADQIALLIAGVVTERGTPAELLARSGAQDLTGAYIALTGQKPSLP